ncbi:hypothetical protein [Thalassotalea sp. SU-HH00458]|uniref:hypothetical protein n=1 Tax=Thalassotalea sp. SU-HH00458 TaxID=3127657 RepID=UPI00310B9746
MLVKYFIVLIVSLVQFKAFAFGTSQKEEPLSANVCGLAVLFTTPYKESRSQYSLSNEVNLSIFQFLSTRVVSGATIATNITCQSIEGMDYSGSEEEWKTFFNNSINTLSKKGVKNLKMTIVGTDRQVYKGNLPFREYKFFGTFNEGDQMIYNLTILNKASNTLYTVSVSGHSMIEKQVINEFKQVTNAINFE